MGREAMVKVLVGKRSQRGFSGFWAKFEGNEAASYENDDIVYTLYKCTAYNFDAYRVHISNEREFEAPVYELHPALEDSHIQGIRPDYTEPYDERQLVERYPIFARHTGFFRTFEVDPPT